MAGPGVTPDNCYGLWIGPPDDFSLIYRDGMQAPGVWPGRGVQAIWGDTPLTTLDSSRSRPARGPGTTSSNRVGHWLGAAGSLELISRDGDPAPLFGPGVFWRLVAVVKQHQRRRRRE